MLLHSVGEVIWPPKIGEPFPRAQDAWYEWSKFEDWILGDKGHGADWASVFRVRLEDWEIVWEAIVEATAGASIREVRDREPFGIACEAKVQLVLGSRSAPVKLSWHYAFPGDAPRLVTAYPTP